jgi:RNA polymerase sigma-70 factor (ECF subfamily)
MSPRKLAQAADLLKPLHRKGASEKEDRPADKDEARVKRAHAGDETVWDEWFEEYYQPLFRYAYLRLRSRSEAEDVTSQAFIEAYRGIGRYQHTGKPLLAWLYRITHNLIYDRIKADARRPETTTEVEPDGDGPEAGIVSMDLVNAIEALTPEQRDVIIMRYFMAMSSIEVGALMGKTQPAVFSLQSRALASLRSRLDGVLEL